MIRIWQWRRIAEEPNIKKFYGLQRHERVGHGNFSELKSSPVSSIFFNALCICGVCYQGLWGRKNSSTRHPYCMILSFLTPSKSSIQLIRKISIRSPYFARARTSYASTPARLRLAVQFVDYTISIYFPPT